MTAYRIFVLILMHFLLGFAFIQWLIIQPVLYAMFNHPGFVVYTGPRGEGPQCTFVNTGKEYTPNMMSNSAGEFILNLTNLVCYKINKDIQGECPYTHRCKFLDLRTPP